MNLANSMWMLNLWCFIFQIGYLWWIVDKDTPKKKVAITIVGLTACVIGAFTTHIH